jgi:hypothetical protein
VTRARGPALPLDDGFRLRILEASGEIRWRPADAPSPAPGAAPTRSALPRSSPRARRSARAGSTERRATTTEARIAHLHDEEARVEEVRRGRVRALTVTSGPVGALVLVGEIAREGVPSELRAYAAGERAGFPDGAIEARWEDDTGAPRLALPIADLVSLARFAL